MAGLLPKFITDMTAKIPLFGGSSENSADNNTESTTGTSNSSKTGINHPDGSNTQTVPKDLNELVDKVMDNSNIDNRTKREILSVILSNLQHQPNVASETSPNTGLTSQHTPAMPALVNPLHHQPPMFYPQQPLPSMFYQQPLPSMFYPQPSMFYPQQPPMFYPQPPMLYPPQLVQQPLQQSNTQMDSLTAKVNELSSEMGQLVKMMKGELGAANNRTAHMDRIRAMINKLSANNSSGQPAPVISESSEESAPSTLSDLPSKPSGPDSVIDTVGSAINSINTALGLNSEAASTKETSANKSTTSAANTPEPSTTSEPSPEPEKKEEELGEADKQLLADEAAAKAANNVVNPAPTGEKADNMIDLDQYKPQETIDDTIDEKSIEEGLNTATAATGATANANKPANNTGVAAANKPANNTGVAAANKPANNLAAAIGNLNKTTAGQEEQKPVEQVGGAKTLKKKSRSVLSSVADVLGLTTITQKKAARIQGAKRGRPRKS
jgi:hypothetical protein